MTSDHRLSLFEFLHAADRLLWSYRSAIDRNARARLTSDDLLLNDFCARAASRARCLLDDELARRARDGGFEPPAIAERDGDDGDANPTASDDDGSEAAGAGGGRGRAQSRRSRAAGMTKLHAAIQARRNAEAQRTAAAASSRDRSSGGAADEPRTDDSEWEEPASSESFGETVPDEGWEHGPDPFESDAGAPSTRRGAHPELPASNTSSAPVAPSATSAGTSGWSSSPPRRRPPR